MAVKTAILYRNDHRSVLSQGTAQGSIQQFHRTGISPHG